VNQWPKNWFFQEDEQDDDVRTDLADDLAIPAKMKGSFSELKSNRALIVGLDTIGEDFVLPAVLVKSAVKVIVDGNPVVQHLPGNQQCGFQRESIPGETE
jgi:hypothetical protein